MDYQKQGEDFLIKYNIKVKATDLGLDYVDWDKDNLHCKFRITFSRNDKRFSIIFWQSLAKGCEPPTAYDVLACITKTDPCTFEDFCSEFGYDTDSRKAEKTYKAVQKEWEKVNNFFSDDEIEELREIN